MRVVTVLSMKNNVAREMNCLEEESTEATEH